MQRLDDLSRPMPDRELNPPEHCDEPESAPVYFCQACDDVEIDPAERVCQQCRDSVRGDWVSDAAFERMKEMCV